MTLTTATVWLTGLPAAGKTTPADALALEFQRRGERVARLGGDALRLGINAGLGFSREDRAEAARRAAELDVQTAGAGQFAIVSMVTPYAEDRAGARALHQEAGVRFLEVFVDTPPAECERRDPRGLYARARRGEISNLTRVDDPFEPPQTPDLRVRAGEHTVAECVELLLTGLLRGAAAGV